MHFLTPISYPQYQFEIPLAFSPVCAGFGNTAEDYIDGKIDLNNLIIKHPAATYLVKVVGDSMRDKGILEGDYVVVDRSVKPTDGKTVIACLNNEFTIKEFKRINSDIILRPANKNYKDIHIKPGDDLEIFGVVISVIRNL